MPTNAWNPSLYDNKHSFVFAYGEDLLALLAPQVGERILDLGCGTGYLTKMIADRGARVTGIDSSLQMIAAAKRSYSDLDFVIGDARWLSFPETFDAVFSNAVLHWIREADAVARSVAKALAIGGRFVTEFGGCGNISRIVGALRASLDEHNHHAALDEWYNPTAEEYVALLARHDLRVTHAELFDRPTKLEDGARGLRNWLAMFRGEVLRPLDEAVKESVISRIEDSLRDTLFHDGSWYADYRRLRIVAFKD